MWHLCVYILLLIGNKRLQEMMGKLSYGWIQLFLYLL